MKKEAVLMLVAGVLFGFIAGWIIREQTLKAKAPTGHAAQPQGQTPPAGAPGAPGGAPPNFDPKAHETMIQQVIEKARQSNDPKDKVLLANIYYDRGNFEEAIKWYEDALKADDKNVNVLVDLGVCYKNTNHPKEAIASFDKALAIEKDKKEALFNKVVVYAFDLKDRAKADAALKRLKEVAPGDPKVAELEAEVNKKSK
jgi:tetratricopeptide (TPR) repeat protein